MADPDVVTVEGKWAVEALLRSGDHSVDEVVVEAFRHPEIVALAEDSGIRVRRETRESLGSEQGYDFHRGILARVQRPEAREPDERFLAGANLIVFAVSIADPGNLGTIIRSAAAFGADGVVVESGKGADPYNRKCIRASATAIFRLPVFEVAGIRRTAERVREEGFVVFGTGLGEGSTSLHEFQPGRRNAIVFGAERDGLAPEWQEICDERLRIPMHGGMDSLNVAISAGVILYEMARLRDS